MKLWSTQTGLFLARKPPGIAIQQRFRTFLFPVSSFSLWLLQMKAVDRKLDVTVNQ